MYIVVVSYDQPNTFDEVPCRHNLETSIIHTAPLRAIFIGDNLEF